MEEQKLAHYLIEPAEKRERLNTDVIHSYIFFHTLGGKKIKGY